MGVEADAEAEGGVAMVSNSAGQEDADDEPDARSGSGGSLPDAALLAYGECADELWRTAARVLRPYGLQANAGDVVQNAVISLMKNPPNPDSWTAEFFTAVKRRAIDFLRGKGALHESASNLEFDGFEDVQPVNVASTTVEDAVVQRDHRTRRNRVIREAVDSLPEQEREVIDRIFYQEQAGARVAEELGVSKGRVSQVKKAALARLADVLDEEEVN